MIRLLDAGEHLDACYGSGSGGTAINTAALHSAAAVQFLAEKGAKLDARTSTSGWTPLMNACHRANLDTTKELLYAGADVVPRAPGLRPRIAPQGQTLRRNSHIAG